MIEHDDRRCSTALVEVNASQRGHTGKIARLKQPRSSGAYRPRRHPDDREALRAPSAELYCRNHSRPFPDPGDCGGKHGDADPGQKPTHSSRLRN
jgi:hypothetical protein